MSTSLGPSIIREYRNMYIIKYLIVLRPLTVHLIFSNKQILNVTRFIENSIDFVSLNSFTMELCIVINLVILIYIINIFFIFDQTLRLLDSLKYECPHLEVPA